MRKLLAGALCAGFLSTGAHAAAPSATGGEAAFRGLYKELVETNTTLSSGSCTLRTTCVATLLDGGHATNALPQRAGANVNCRIFPGHSIEEIRQQLEQIVADKGVTVTAVPPVRPVAGSPPLDPKVIGPMEKLAARYFPGVPVVPTMNTGGTDAVFLTAGIPTYGVPGSWMNPDGNGAHGLNERVEVQSVLTGRAYLYELVKAYTGGR